MDRLKEISSTGTGFSATFDYAYNDANQRTVITNADNSRWVYVYDDLGQVISGKKYWSDGTPVAGQQFEYGFDDIGNRTATTNNTRVASYSANNVNQYTSRTVPGYVDVLGAAHSNATVTVNFQSTERKGEYFRKELSIDNTNAAVWQGITNIGVLNDGSNPDIVTTNIGNVFLAQTPENFTHDLDGNLTQNGRFTFVWDGENRAVSFESLTTAPTASKRKVDCVYDYQSRRIQKIAYTNDGTSYVGQYTNKFIYDGWNLKAILDGQNALLCSFAWGSDLSGSMQGAGGVGGLISMTVHSGALAGTYFYAFDGNGNVAKLINGADGSIAAEYEYDPFGRLLRATGPLAFINPFRFSTKYQDDETGFIYYGYRYYDSDSGRWLSRDPIEERGGLNLLGFVQNDPISAIDPRGQFGVFGFALGVGVDVAIQVGLNIATGETWYDIDVTTAVVSGLVTAVAPQIAYGKAYSGLKKVGSISSKIKKAKNTQVQVSKKGKKVWEKSTRKLDSLVKKKAEEIQNLARTASTIAVVQAIKYAGKEIAQAAENEIFSGESQCGGVQPSHNSNHEINDSGVIPLENYEFGTDWLNNF